MCLNTSIMSETTQSSNESQELAYLINHQMKKQLKWPITNDLLDFLNETSQAIYELHCEVEIIMNKIEHLNASLSQVKPKD